MLVYVIIPYNETNSLAEILRGLVDLYVPNKPLPFYNQNKTRFLSILETQNPNFSLDNVKLSPKIIIRYVLTYLLLISIEFR